MDSVGLLLIRKVVVVFIFRRFNLVQGFWLKQVWHYEFSPNEALPNVFLTSGFVLFVTDPCQFILVPRLFLFREIPVREIPVNNLALH